MEVSANWTSTLERMMGLTEYVVEVTQVLERSGRMRVSANDRDQAKQLAETDARAGNVIFDDEVEISLKTRVRRLE